MTIASLVGLLCRVRPGEGYVTEAVCTCLWVWGFRVCSRQLKDEGFFVLYLLTIYSGQGSGFMGCKDQVLGFVARDASEIRV